MSSFPTIHRRDVGTPPTKFHLRLKGPYLVDNKQGDKYACCNLVTDDIEDIHTWSLRYDARFVDPRDIALRDNDECYVEKILGHSGIPKKL